MSVCSLFLYLPHLPEEDEGSLQRLHLFPTQNSLCGGAVEDVVSARALDRVSDLDVGDLRGGTRENPH